MTGGYCFTNSADDDGEYNIPCDKDGNSVLTGQGKGQDDDDKEFTCTAVEVFLVE